MENKELTIHFNKI